MKIADPSIEELEKFFISRFEEFPRCLTTEAIVVGERELTPSIIRRAAEIAATGNLGYNFTFVGARHVKDMKARSSYILGMQTQSGLTAPKDGETESQYMFRLFQNEIARVKGHPDQFEMFCTEFDKTRAIHQQVKLAFKMMDLPEYAEITPESGDTVAIAVVATPWLMPRVLASMRRHCDRMGRSYCFVPYPVWPVEANMFPDLPRPDGAPMPMFNWKHPYNPSARVGFIQEYQKIGSPESRRVKSGRYKPVDILAEAERVEGHINIHRGTYRAPA